MCVRLCAIIRVHSYPMVSLPRHEASARRTCPSRHLVQVDDVTPVKVHSAQLDGQSADNTNDCH